MEIVEFLKVADILNQATECVPKTEITESNPHLKNLYEGLKMTETVLKNVRLPPEFFHIRLMHVSYIVYTNETRGNRASVKLKKKIFLLHAIESSRMKNNISYIFIVK